MDLSNDQVKIIVLLVKHIFVIVEECNFYLYVTLLYFMIN